MARILKWVLWGTAILLALAILAGIALYAIAKNTVQPLSGDMKLMGLSAPVSVVRDANGIPHIEAKTRIDAAMALGFTHAQDRMWQMEMLRMTGQGRLSEMFGVSEDIQNIDKLLRTLGFLEQSKGSISALTEESQAVLQAYAKGVNAFLERPTSLTQPALPTEFLILGHTPEKWKPEHSLVVLKIMALNLSMNMGREIDRMKLAAQGFSSGEIDDIFPYHRDDSPPPLPALNTLYRLIPALEKSAKLPSKFAGITDRWMNEGGHFASNNWVLAGNRTTSGKPLLANDPHLTFNAPSLWYLAHMSWTGKDGQPVNVIGSTIPSVPAVVLGRNNHIAWGFTNAGGDAQDLFVEKMRGDNNEEYLTPTGWQKFKTTKEIIKVKGGVDITLDVKVSRHGPLLPKTYKSYGDVLPKDHALALAWTGLSDRDQNFDVVSGFATSKSVDDFATHVGKSVAPMQVMVVADIDGNIGMFAKAALPKRKPENTVQGRAPVPGWKAQYDWDGLLPPDTMPAITNPINGALGSANTKFVPNNTDPFLTYDWTEAFRYDRLSDTILNRNEKADKAAMIAGQLDSYSPAMVRLRDHVLRVMRGDASQKARLDGLQAWDGRMKKDAPQPLMMTAIFRHTLENVLKDDLGANYATALSMPATVLLSILESGGARDWCDVAKTQHTETCNEQLRDAYSKAMTELETDHGSNWKAWRWGDVHTISNEHQPFGKIFPLNKFYDIERPANGGAYTLQRAKNKFSDKRPYRATHGAGYRAVYDFEDLNKSIFIQTTGQSGNAFSRFYDSFADKWAEGEYVPMLTDKTQYDKGAVGVWRLEPAN